MHYQHSCCHLAQHVVGSMHLTTAVATQAYVNGHMTATFEQRDHTDLGIGPISTNLRDFGPPNGSCDHGPIPIFWFGGRYPKPTRDLSIKMRSLSMPTAQKALQAW